MPRVKMSRATRVALYVLGVYLAFMLILIVVRFIKAL